MKASFQILARRLNSCLGGWPELPFRSAPKIAAGLPEGVAQTSSLLYRRILFCMAQVEPFIAGFIQATQAASLGYSRLKTCATPSGLFSSKTLNACKTCATMALT